MSDTIEVATFGCRVNIADSEIIRREAARALASAYIVNTCAVTQQAVREAGQAIRRAYRADPSRPVIVTGCAAQIEPDHFSAMPEVARVLGNREKLAAQNYQGIAPGLGERRVGDMMTGGALEPQLTTSITDHTRGFVQVQSGCDHRCTFCVIPFGRGASRSLPSVDVVASVRRFVEAGAKDVVLTGVDLTSYGGELDEGIGLGRLVRLILAQCSDLPRLRLSSLDCIEADASLLSAFAEEERLMPSVHLSLQSGDDLILKRMKRRHSRRDAIALCQELKRLRPDMVISADIIAGFPTETEGQFAGSLALIDDCGLSRVHAFSYSPRPGTPAARMPSVAPAVIKERAGRLRAKSAEAYAASLERALQRTHLVLSERGKRARSAGGHMFHVEAEAGQFLMISATHYDGQILYGSVV